MTPGVAPRIAPRMGFSHELGRERNSESCFENIVEFRELLREWPFHSESASLEIAPRTLPGSAILKILRS